MKVIILIVAGIALGSAVFIGISAIRAPNLDSLDCITIKDAKGGDAVICGKWAAAAQLARQSAN